MGKDKSADGLRGIASLSVVLHHSLLMFFPASMLRFFGGVATPGAATGLTEKLASTPVLSVLWNGRLAVCIFFVLSGYVLSAKFVRDGDANHIRAQAARRYMRLGIPIFASAVFACALYMAGAYRIESAAGISGSAWLMIVRPIGLDWAEAIRQGLYSAMLLTKTTVNPPLYTMHVEFFGSLLTFAFCLLGRGRERFMSALFVIVMMVVSPEEWPYYVAFLIGFFLARAEAPTWKLAPIVAVFFGVVVADAAAFDGAWSWVPIDLDYSHRFTLSNVAGGALIVYGVRFGALRRVLCSPPFALLGRISFPLYLTHFPILASLGCGIFVSGIAAGASRGLSAAAGVAASLIVLIPLSMVFERLVDTPAIAWSKRLIGDLRGTSKPSAEPGGDGNLTREA